MISYRDRVEAAVDLLIATLRAAAPKKEWNLTNNGIRKVYDQNAYPYIIIGGEPAPYALYTNEPWIDERWNGAINPNQGWVQEAIRTQVVSLEGILSGTITTDEFIVLLQTQEAILDAKIKARIT